MAVTPEGRAPAISIAHSGDLLGVALGPVRSLGLDVERMRQVTKAREIAAKSPVAIRLAKHALNTIEELSLRDGYRFEQSMTGELTKTEDSKEAMRAFVEKRPPVFTGG